MNPKHIWLQPKRIVAATVSAALLMQSGIPAYAAVSQNPAVYTAQPDANVMFSLDDSGSMTSDVIPDLPTDLTANDAGDSTPDLGKFPPVTGSMAQLDGIIQATYFGAACYSNWNLCFSPYKMKFPIMWANNSAFRRSTYYEDSAVARFLRSPTSNPIYYDRRVTYNPWPNPADDKTLLPNATPSSVKISYQNPSAPDTTINLTVKNSDLTGGGSYWPATYYVYTGATAYDSAAGFSAAQNTSSNFTKVEIKPAVLNYTRSANDARTDCGSTATCTYAQELQNFANWLQYYHNRMLMAKGGVAAAFAKQQTNLRVGFATINAGILKGVATFDGTARTTFYDTLYARSINGGTPLREAMDTVGKYFTIPSSPSAAQLLNSPYAFTPTSVHLPEYDCRKSFHILSTDGYWNGNPAGPGPDEDNDNFAAEPNTPPKKTTGITYAYSDSASSPTDPLVGRFTIKPFQDAVNSQENTLADVAAYYWKKDLYPGLANNLSPSARDPAFWQHLTTFTVGLGITGTGAVSGLDDPDARQDLITNKTAVNWPDVSAESATTGDDLIRASMVGRGRYFSATNPTTLSAGLASALAEATDQPLSLSSLAPESGNYYDGSQVYQATFNPSQWYGRLYSFNQAANGSIDTSPAAAEWEASNKMPTPADRKIYSFNPVSNTGSLFDFGANGLTGTQKDTIDNDANLLNYLRGDDAKEAANGGSFRDRARYTVGNVTGGVLGDIVNSTPVVPPAVGVAYQKLPAGTPGRDSYATFRSPSNADISDYLNTIFVGANDGMLHAFNKTTGVERFAYVPNSVFSVPRSVGGATEAKLKMLAQPSYSHRFTVDGPPQVSDAFIGDSNATAQWRSVLNASTGAGARSIFVMDVTKTQPGSGAFGTDKILWELSETTPNDTEAADHMGYIPSYGHVALMPGDRWVLIFGNGYDSLKGQAVLFIRDLFTGAKVATIKVGNEGGNGLSQPNFVLKDRRVQFIYAGDLKGNLWKFDVTSATPADWKSAFETSGVAKPLFEGSASQPITVMPTIGFKHPNGGHMISFGTGKLFDTEDQATDSSNVNLGTQTIYGIWDKPSQTAGISGNTLLVQQSMSGIAATADTSMSGTSTATIDWTTKRGWFINLAAGGERVNVNPQLPIPTVAKAPLFVVANKPAAAVPCETGGTARVFALDAYTGSAPSFGVFDADLSGTINASDAGYNVWSLSTMVSQPLFQTQGGSGAGVSTGEGKYGATGAREGGREDLSSGSDTGDCYQVMGIGRSDTSTESKNVVLCPKGKGRISWRQIQ